MADEPKQPRVVEAVPSSEDSVSAIASGNAPFVYFDRIEGFGTYNGVTHVTLSAIRFMPAASGELSRDKVIVAHLRMNIPAMRALKAALDAIEGMLNRPSDAPVN